MASRYGLIEVDSLPGGTVPSAYIVFVHGLFGHPFKTWSAESGARPSPCPHRTAISESAHRPLKNPEEVFWPRDLLRNVIKDARIFTWGYNADVDGLFTAASQNTVQQYATNLLSDLIDQLEVQRPKPAASQFIVFVTHSLGGLIVKDALNQSSRTEGTRLKKIAPATFGVCFLGTPHRGSSTASIGKIAYTATRVATRRPNTKLLRALELNSDTLDRIGSEFLDTIRRRSLRIYSFREEYETRKYLVLHSIVVKADSAKIGHESEESSSIPADHSHMTKFSSADDIGFRRVSAQLRRWVEEVKAADTALLSRYECLDSLNDPIARTRISEVHKQYESTFQWLFDPGKVDFANWLRQMPGHNGRIFWIQGKPGSGKSTLMKMALQAKETYELLIRGPPSSAPPPGSNASDSQSISVETCEPSPPTWIRAGFFFHDRGTNTQKSLAGMMKELLYQVLNHDKALMRFIYPIYEEIAKDQRTQYPSWGLGALRNAWIALIEQRNVNLRLLLFLDALDEHETTKNGEDNEQLARIIKELAKIENGQTVVLFCLASRSWTDFEKAFSECPGFAIQDHTKSDIERFARGRISPVLNSSSPDWESLISGITLKASGVFIWVRLVVDEMIKAIKDGTPLSDVQKKLERMPKELGELYVHTLRRIEADYQLEAYIMLQLVIYSRAPQTLETVYECVHFLKNHSHSKESTSGTAMVRFLTSRSGGLLETVSRQVPFPFDAKYQQSSPSHSAPAEPEKWSIVQVIHQTVKDFVLDTGINLPITDNESATPLLTGYLYLLRCATEGSKHHSTAHLREDFLYYAQHAEQERSGLPQTALEKYLNDSFRDFVSDTKSGKWLLQWSSRHKIFQALPAFESDRLWPQPTPYISLVLSGLAVAAGLSSYGKVRFYDTSFDSDKSYNDFIDKFVATTEVSKLFNIRNPLTPLFSEIALHIAVAAATPLPDGLAVEPLVALGVVLGTLQSEDLADLLVDHKTTMVFRQQHQAVKYLVLVDIIPLATLLMAQNFTTASDEGRLAVAKYLLEHGANSNAQIKIGWLPRDGIQISRDGLYMQTCLHHCARFENAAMVRLFLQHGADPYSKDDMNMTPLMHAAMRGDNAVKLAFRDAGFDPVLKVPTAASHSSPDDEISGTIWPWLVIPTNAAISWGRNFQLENHPRGRQRIVSESDVRSRAEDDKVQLRREMQVHIPVHANSLGRQVDFNSNRQGRGRADSDDPDDPRI